MYSALARFTKSNRSIQVQLQAKRREMRFANDRAIGTHRCARGGDTLSRIPARRHRLISLRHAIGVSAAAASGILTDGIGGTEVAGPQAFAGPSDVSLGGAGAGFRTSLWTQVSGVKPTGALKGVRD